ncbi:hypothetical protein [Pseudomonas fluorescens]|uniref:Uncharacterized protein n=1 Tax=Pseudomonas fluorescens TaxID=294 RepID=A0A5E7P6Y3_PSEFL|nr:hypothetical protein [Pseudomonas fluorescens]VVP45049.1 hypothetical protein PS880_05051 [Pseudomonas fluorescens]
MTDPVNPFTLPALAEDEVIYTDSRLKTAASLAAHYIAARVTSDPEMSRIYNSDIGAFLSEEFGPGELSEYDFFAMRFGALMDQCDEALPLVYHKAWLK